MGYPAHERNSGRFAIGLVVFTVMLLALGPTAHAAVPPISTKPNQMRLKIPVLLGSKDFHVKLDSKIMSISMSPLPPSNDNTTDDGKQWHAVWTTAHAPGSDPKTVEIKFSQQNAEGAYKWTFSGDIGEIIDWSTGTPFGIMIYERFPTTSNDFRVKGNFKNGTDPLTVGPIEAIAVTDEALFDAPNWYEATGTTYNIAGGTIAPGEVGHEFASGLPLGDATWVLIKTTLDGSPVEFAEIVPEPGALSMAVTAALLALRRRGRGKNRDRIADFGD